MRALPQLAVIRDSLRAVTIFAVGGAGACRSSPGAPSDANRKAGGGQPLAPNENGRVDVTTTGTTAIRGRWFASADTEDCSKKGRHAAADCSLLVAPDPKAPVFQPIKDLGMCAVGVAAKVLERADGNPDWDNIWGARIGLALNDDAPFDARAHGVTGFAFHIDFEPPPNAGIRVQLPTVTATGGGLEPWLDLQIVGRQFDAYEGRRRSRCTSTTTLTEHATLVNLCGDS